MLLFCNFQFHPYIAYYINLQYRNIFLPGVMVTNRDNFYSKVILKKSRLRFKALAIAIRTIAIAIAIAAKKAIEYCNMQ